MKTAQTDEFDEVACPYCGLIVRERHNPIYEIARCLGCRHEFQVIEKDRYSDAIGENFPVIE